MSDEPAAPTLALAQARARMLAGVTPIAERETLPLMQALGRVLADPVTAQVDVPGHTNSAMDGFALRSTDARGDTSRLRLIGDSFAGHPFAGPVGPGECVRIMTGGVLPEGADAVVMQERTRRDGDEVIVERPVDPGSSIRPAGEDLARGQPVLDAGRRITPADLGMLASGGAAEVSVFRRPRVAFYSTGDELRPVGTPLQPGQIYDSNRYSLHALLSELGVELLDLGVVPDDPTALETTLRRAAADCDAVVTSGGVSVGEADHVLDVLESVGDVGFWKVAMKPGKPLAFGRVDDALFFGLPGNPVSVVVTFLQLVRPALVRLAGSWPRPPLRVSAKLASPIRRNPGRLEFQRGRLAHDEAGATVAPLGHQGSGVLRSMSEADCFIVLPPDCAELAAGDRVSVEPFAQPVWNGSADDWCEKE